MPYVNHRWLGGLLTNFQTISLRIRRLHDLERYESEGQLQLLPTRERISAQADLEKLRANLGGVKNMERVPNAVFVIDLKTEAIAVREAQRLRIPIIGLVDTNCDPDGIDYVIPGNDDAIRSCAAVTRAIGDVVADSYGAYLAEEEGRWSGSGVRPRSRLAVRPRSRLGARPRRRPRQPPRPPLRRRQPPLREPRPRRLRPQREPAATTPRRRRQPPARRRAAARAAPPSAAAAEAPPAAAARGRSPRAAVDEQPPPKSLPRQRKSLRPEEPLRQPRPPAAAEGLPGSRARRRSEPAQPPPDGRSREAEEPPLRGHDSRGGR